MNARPKPLSLDGFLTWEERQELRYEYDGFVARAMTGGSGAHTVIQANLLGLLFQRLRGSPCRAVGSGLKVRTESSIRYPDALVTCTPIRANATIAPDPVVIFEILSKSTARYDLGPKNAEYQTLGSLKRYVVLDQTRAYAQVFSRDEEGAWVYESVTAEGALDMPEIGATPPLAEIYEGVEL